MARRRRTRRWDDRPTSSDAEGLRDIRYRQKARAAGERGDSFGEEFYRRASQAAWGRSNASKSRHAWV